MARLSIKDSLDSTERIITMYIEREIDARDEASAIRKGIQEGIKLLSEKWVEENQDKIMERLNVDAITNMIMIEVANSIKKDIREEKK